MKRILYVLLALLSCTRESEWQPILPRDSVTEVSATVLKAGLDGSAKSICGSGVEEIAEAYVFAFPKNAENICTYQADDGAHPFATHVTGGGAFHWTLPVGVDLEIWALANPDTDELKETLEEYVSSTHLTKQDLRSLPDFVCTDWTRLKELEESGRNLPMSGIGQVRFSAARGTLTIPVKRLFAKYTLQLNFSRFHAAGWSIRAAGVQCVNCNPSVPYFYTGGGVGAAAEAANLVPVLDRDGEGDLDLLNTLSGSGISTTPVAFYFPENCQGTILDAAGNPARGWKTVRQDLGERVAACSYLAVNVAASRDGGQERRFTYRIYPGSERAMNRNFDIVRNSFKALSVTLTPDMETDAFRWTPSETLTVAPGETLDIPYETTLPAPCFTTSGDALSWVSAADGTARFQAASSAADGMLLYAVGGDEGFGICDRVAVTVVDRLPIRLSIPEGIAFFQPFTLRYAPSRGDWPDGVDPASLTVSSLASTGREALEVLSSRPGSDAEGWYFLARCTGPRSASDKGETLVLKNGDEILGQLEVEDVGAVFTPPIINYSSDAALPGEDRQFALSPDGSTPTTLNLYFEGETGGDIYIPDRYVWLDSFDNMVDGFYLERHYGSHLNGNTWERDCLESADIYLPCWEGVDGLQDFDRSRCSWLQDPYIQRVNGQLCLLSKTGYAFYTDELSFFIENPFYGLDVPVQREQLVVGRKLRYPSQDWSLSGDIFEWHIPRDGERPEGTSYPVLLSEQGATDSRSSYQASPRGADGQVLPYDIVKIPRDIATYGKLGFYHTARNARSGEESAIQLAEVDVVRELVVSADFRIHQRHYPLLSPYDEEARIRVSPTFSDMTALSPFVGMAFLKCTATSSTTVHPTKAEAESLGPFWVNYAASLGTHAYFSNSTYLAPSEGSLSYEILWNPGPSAGYFNYRVVTLWNPPQYDFDIPGFRAKYPDAFPDMRLVPASGGRCRYLEMDAYTRIVFYWENWRSSYTDSGKGWYLCENGGTTPRYASAYYQSLSTLDPMYGRCFFGSPDQTGTDVDPVYGGDPFFIQSNSNTFETILDY